MKFNKIYFLFFICFFPISSFVFGSKDLIGTIVKDSALEAISATDLVAPVLFGETTSIISNEFLKSFFQKFSSTQPVKSVFNFGRKIYIKGTENPTISAGAVCCLVIAAGLVYFIEKDKQACHDSIVALSEQPTIVGFLCTQYLLIEQRINEILNNAEKTKTDEEKVVLNNLIAERDKIETAILAIYKKENSFFTRLKSVIYKNK